MNGEFMFVYMWMSEYVLVWTIAISVTMYMYVWWFVALYFLLLFLSTYLCFIVCLFVVFMRRLADAKLSCYSYNSYIAVMFVVVVVWFGYQPFIATVD